MHIILYIHFVYILCYYIVYIVYMLGICWHHLPPPNSYFPWQHCVTRYPLSGMLRHKLTIILNIVLYVYIYIYIERERSHFFSFTRILLIYKFLTLFLTSALDKMIMMMMMMMMMGIIIIMIIVVVVVIIIIIIIIIIVFP